SALTLSFCSNILEELNLFMKIFNQQPLAGFQPTVQNAIPTTKTTSETPQNTLIKQYTHASLSYNVSNSTTKVLTVLRQPLNPLLIPPKRRVHSSPERCTLSSP